MPDIRDQYREALLAAYREQETLSEAVRSLRDRFEIPDVEARRVRLSIASAILRDAAEEADALLTPGAIAFVSGLMISG